MDGGTKIVRVAVADATRGYDREYDYYVPETLAASAEAGRRAVVPFGTGDKKRLAIILSVSGSRSISGGKYVSEIPDTAPLLRAMDIKLAAYMRVKYRCTWFDAFRCILPKGWDRATDQSAVVTGFVKKTVKAVRLAVDPDSVLDGIGSFRIKRIQHIRVLQTLLKDREAATNGVLVKHICDESGVSQGVIDTLVRYGYLEKFEKQEDRVGFRSDANAADMAGSVSFAAEAPVCLTRDQTDVVRSLTDRLSRGGFSEVLLHGVTGSGKTEVYLRLIGRVVEAGRQAIVLVPEISLTPQMTRWFTARFSGIVAVFHSRLSDGERREQWRRVWNGSAKIALGARSAVFAPFSDIGLIIIDEEHETSYKSDMNPRYHAAEIAKKRCVDHGALLVYGSATPSVDLYHRAVAGDEIGLAVMRERANNQKMPEVFISDMREEIKGGNRGMFGRLLRASMDATLRAGKQAIIFLNRRGFASFLLCRDCGYIVSCRECSVSYTYHSEDARLICHYCGMTAPVPAACPVCQGPNISAFGTGTERVEKEVRSLYPGYRTLRMDRDTTSGKNAHERILNTFHEGGADILIGTQMIAKGHDFPNVTLVGILAADSILNFSDYRAAERSFQLLTQAAGRAGRGDTPGSVIIQTYNPDHYSIAAAQRHDYEWFYSQEITARKALLYPPFANIGVFLLSGTCDDAVRSSAEELFGELRSILGTLTAAASNARVFSPGRAPIACIGRHWRWRIIIKHKSEHVLLDIINSAHEWFYRRRGQKSRGLVELASDINPHNMT